MVASFYLLITLPEIPTYRNVMFGGELIGVNEDYQWVVLVLSQIGRIYTKVCSGSVIAPNWVLTAAHCLEDEGRLVAANAVTINVYSKMKNFHRYHVANTFRHPNYGAKEFQETNDIGLIQTREAMKVNSGLIRQSKDYPNTTCTLIGFGQSERLEMGPTLAKITVNLMSEKMCRGLNQGGNNWLCLAAVYGIGPCVGDSGSPMICDGKIAGVCSRGLFVNNSSQTCGAYNFAIVVYERVDTAWVSQVIEMHSSSDTLRPAGMVSSLSVLLVSVFTEWS